MRIEARNLAVGQTVIVGATELTILRVTVGTDVRILVRRTLLTGQVITGSYVVGGMLQVA